MEDNEFEPEYTLSMWFSDLMGDVAKFLMLIVAFGWAGFAIWFWAPVINAVIR